MSDTPKNEQIIDLKSSVKDILSIIEQEREREIITRRFGLYDVANSEQIGTLGITVNASGS